MNEIASMPTVVITQAFVIDIPDQHARYTIAAESVMVRCGLKFVELDPKDSEWLRWLTGYRAWSRPVSQVLKELESLRTDAFHKECAIDEGSVPRTIYASKKRARAIKTNIGARFMDVAEVTLPEFELSGMTIDRVVTNMPFRSSGLIQLQLDPAVWRWLWARVKSTEAPDTRRNAPGKALHEGKDNIYWHKQKQGWVAKRPVDGSPELQKYKTFKPGSSDDVVVALEEAHGWNHEHE
jgi:hypothetical protein